MKLSFLQPFAYLTTIYDDNDLIHNQFHQGLLSCTGTQLLLT